MPNIIIDTDISIARLRARIRRISYAALAVLAGAVVFFILTLVTLNKGGMYGWSAGLVSAVILGGLSTLALTVGFCLLMGRTGWLQVEADHLTEVARRPKLGAAVLHPPAWRVREGRPEWFRVD